MPSAEVGFSVADAVVGSGLDSAAAVVGFSDDAVVGFGFEVSEPALDVSEAALTIFSNGFDKMRYNHSPLVASDSSTVFVSAV